MNVNTFLTQVAHTGTSTIDGDDGLVYYSNFDDSYITRVGLEDDIKFLVAREITDELAHGVGFSPKENKWYGWSHRAICGFEIGATCKKSDCHYRAANIQDEIEAARAFWNGEGHSETNAELQADGTIHVSWKYAETIPNKKLRSTIGGCDWDYDPNNFGRGEWIAGTMEDAKQMAVDFNEGVS